MVNIFFTFRGGEYLILVAKAVKEGARGHIFICHLKVSWRLDGESPISCAPAGAACLQT